ncbi:glycosyltransferase family 4 protein [Puniceicoccaceae bacterium K14]|nr:glycosyltransferase family 4 protein [Puniceicoccaceae bacterium K14]
MKVALFHNYYAQRGGEDEIFEMECRELERLGHDVVTYSVNNDKVLAGKSLFGKARLAWEAPNNRDSYYDVFEFLNTHQPDIGHVHNWFPVISPSIYRAHEDFGIPVVQTLHNYRLGCANGTYRRNGAACEKCLCHGKMNAVKHRCYRESLVGSYSWKRIMDKIWGDRVVIEKVDQYICPSEEVAQRHLKMGLPKERISVIWNACEDPGRLLLDKQDDEGNGGVVFLGRLVDEKGVDVLIEAWKQLQQESIFSHRNGSKDLTIIGEGDASPTLKQLAGDCANIEFTGQLPHDEAMHRLSEASVLVFPSRWAEPFGLGIIEAMAAGKAVVASNIGAPKELIDDNVDGVLVPPENSQALAASLSGLLINSKRTRRIGRAARAKYELNFKANVHAQRLVRLYAKTIIKRGENNFLRN